jgi:hypothetical protein
VPGLQRQQAKGKISLCERRGGLVVTLNLSAHQWIAFGFQADDKINVKDVRGLSMSVDLTNTLLCLLGHQEDLPRGVVKVQAQARNHRLTVLLLPFLNESRPRTIYKTSSRKCGEG